MKPLPSVGTSYNNLLYDEEQRQVSIGTQFLSNSSSFNASMTNIGVPSNSAWSNTGVSNFGIPSRVSFESSKVSVVCKYFKNPGHNIERCYKFHGFPPNFKINAPLGPKRSATHVELEPFGIPRASPMPIGRVE